MTLDPAPHEPAVIDPQMVDRLATHRTLRAVPREQLEWLVARSYLRQLAGGEVVGSKNTPIDALYAVLKGHLVIRVDRGAGPRKVMEWREGDVTGRLPYSRLSNPPGITTAEEPTELLMMHSRYFPEMIRTCHELTAILVHVMLDRARRFTTSDLQDEKMISLGRLAAGLAHELNNPASAVARSAKELSARLFEMEAASLALGAAGLTAGQLAAIARVRGQCIDPGADAGLSPLARADRDDAVAEWLARNGLSRDIGEALAETPLTVEDLEPLGRAIGRDALEFALRSIGASCRTRRLTAEVEMAAGRVHHLVAAIKGFTHMDQAGVRKPVDIRQGLTDTMTVLGGKARGKSVTVAIEAPDDLPAIDGYGGELNQVWANLIDNAIDATPESGHVQVCASSRDGSVVVQVVDNGPGVPEEIRERIFEPFFTTKPQGQGTGIGLDIVRRLLRQHGGTIEVDSRPGRTEFKVVLPPVQAGA
jgi:signal transduction histidine kinase